MPALKIFTHSIDFGMCLPKNSKTFSLLLENLLPIKCPLVLALSTHSTACFSIPYTQGVMDGSASENLSISVTPNEKGIFLGTLYIIAFGIQIVTVTLKVTCGSSLTVWDEFLDFGPTDIFFDGVCRTLRIMNADVTNSLPITFYRSSEEIMFNQKESLILAPGESREVKVHFSPTLCGMRKELLKLMAPNSVSQSIQILAFSGPELSIPILQDIFFLPYNGKVRLSQQIPITNISGQKVAFTISVPSGFPVTFSVLPATEDTLKYQFANENEVGVLIEMDESSTILLEIGIENKFSGLFKIPLTTNLVKPNTHEFCTHYLYALSMPAAEITSPELKKTIGLRTFLTIPHTIPVTQNTNEVTNNAEELMVSNLFGFAEERLFVFGNESRYPSALTGQFVVLQNKTKSSQVYQLFLSVHFSTESTLYGTIPASSELKIPIRFNSKFYLDKETINYTALGTIFAVSQDSKVPGIAACQLFGIIGDLIWNQMRREVTCLEFLPFAIKQESTRTISIRNKTSIPLQAKVNLSCTDENRASEFETFSLKVDKFLLQPFDCFELDLRFTAPFPGNFASVLSIEYYDPNNSKLLISGTRSLPKLNLRSCVDPFRSEILLGSADLFFGNSDLEKISKRKLTIKNGSSVDADVLLSVPVDFVLSSIDTLIKVNRSTTFEFAYDPYETNVSSRYLEFQICNHTYSLPLFGVCGTVCMNADLVTLLPVQSIDEVESIIPGSHNILNFGSIFSSSEATKVLRLVNSGDLRLDISVEFESEELKWKIPTEKFKDLKFESTKFMDKEIDWDEIDCKILNDVDPVNSNICLEAKQFQNFELTIQSTKLVIF